MVKYAGKLKNFCPKPYPIIKSRIIASTQITYKSDFLSFMAANATKNKKRYSILLNILKKATLEKTSEIVGKIKSTPCKVDTPPITQNSKMGIVNGVFKVAFLKSKAIVQDKTVKTISKSS